MLESERNWFQRHHTETVVKDVSEILEEHRSGAHTLSSQDAALLETHLEQAKLLGPQKKIVRTFRKNSRPIATSDVVQEVVQEP